MKLWELYQKLTNNPYEIMDRSFVTLRHAVSATDDGREMPDEFFVDCHGRLLSNPDDGIPVVVYFGTDIKPKTICYTVELKETRIMCVEVLATSEEEAQEMVDERYARGVYDGHMWDECSMEAEVVSE